MASFLDTRRSHACNSVKKLTKKSCSKRLSRPFDICAGLEYFSTVPYGCKMKRSTSLCLGSPDGLWPSSSHAPIPQSDWSQTVLTENPSVCTFARVRVWGCVCRESERRMHLDDS